MTYTAVLASIIFEVELFPNRKSIFSILKIVAFSKANDCYVTIAFA